MRESFSRFVSRHLSTSNSKSWKIGISSLQRFFLLIRNFFWKKSLDSWYNQSDNQFLTDRRVAKIKPKPKLNCTGDFLLHTFASDVAIKTRAPMCKFLHTKKNLKCRIYQDTRVLRHVDENSNWNSIQFQDTRVPRHVDENWNCTST